MSTTAKIKAIWKEHTRCEFELRDAEAAMATMTDNPQVNHVHTLMGAKAMKRFTSFININLFLVYPLIMISKRFLVRLMKSI